MRKYEETNSQVAKRSIEQVMTTHECEACHGKRLRPESLAVTVGGLDIDTLTHMSITKELEFFENLELSERDMIIADLILKEIKSRLRFLKSVGLEYLDLARSAGTLSGGESQRIRLLRRSVPLLWECCISWTSRALDCINGITISSSPP